MTEEPVSQVARPEERQRTPLLLILACLMLILGVLACIGAFVWTTFDLGRPDHWKPGDHPYHAQCGKDCITLGPVGAPGDAGSKPVATLAYDPRTNDRIAQWGDCLQSVYLCANARPGAPEAVLPACVQQSQCPTACKDRFRAETAGLTGKPLVKAYLAMFSAKGGYCTPRGS